MQAQVTQNSSMKRGCKHEVPPFHANGNWYLLEEGESVFLKGAALGVEHASMEGHTFSGL